MKDKIGGVGRYYMDNFRKEQMKSEEQIWKWLERGELKKETEGMIVTAKDQALQTNWILVHCVDSVEKQMKPLQETCPKTVQGMAT